MQKFMIIMYMAFNLFCLVSCEKDITEPAPPPLPPPDSTKPILLWQHPIEQDTGEYAASVMLLVEGDPIYSIDFTSPSGRLERRDAATGSLVWRFDQFFRPIDDFSEGKLFHHAEGLLAHDSHRTYNVDASGNLVWGTDVSIVGKGYAFANVIGDAVYTIHYAGTPPKITNSSIVRAPLATGIWDTLVTFDYPGDDYYLFIKPPALWVHPSGDTILIIRDIRILDATIGLGDRASLHAWNMRTRSFEWTRFDYDPDGKSGNEQPVVKDNRLYISGLNRVYCMDLMTGATLWETQLPRTLITCNLLVYNNLVIAQADSQNGSWALDAATGAIVWHNPASEGASYGGRRLVDGVLYHTASGTRRLWAIDAATGKTLWTMNSPNNKFPKTNDAGFGFQSVYVDSVRQVLYASDRYFLMCFKLPKR
jgi:outer membrane protein assembly factor BamB